jgi:putative Ca2+/H+ antiporter (TMEM165/GDT1 family)
LAARYGLSLVVWAGAVSALITKGALAASFGVGIRRWIRQRLSPEVVRYCGVGVLLILGLLTMLETLLGNR